MKLADYFWILLFLLGITVILVFTVAFRTFVMGVQSSHIYLYMLLFLAVFCVMTLVAWIQVGEKRSSDVVLLLFYYVFSVVFSLCLMSVAEPLLGVNLLSSYEAFENHINVLIHSLNAPLALHIPHSLLAVVLSLLLGALPPLMVSSAFRYSQLQLQRRTTPLSLLTTHLPLLILLLSCRPFLNALEGRQIGSFILTADLWWSFRALLVFLWILCRVLAFRPLLQQYLNEGAGTAIRDSIAASMIDALRAARYNPGSDMGKVKYPNAMYYIPNWVFAVAVQLCVPVVLLGALFTLSVCLGDGAEGVWLAGEMTRVGLPLHPFAVKPSWIVARCAEVVEKAFPGVELASLRLLTPELLRDGSAFVFVFCFATYYFLQCVGHVYWRNQSVLGVCYIPELFASGHCQHMQGEQH